MIGFKPLDSSFKRRLLFVSLGFSALAAIVYSLTLASYIFPGHSAVLFTQWMGLDAMRYLSHPLWGKVVKFAGELGFPASIAVRVNLVSLVSGALSAGLLCWLVAFFVWQTVSHEDSVKFARGAALLAGCIAAAAFVFSSAVWNSATHLEFRMFDLAYALAVTSLFALCARWPRLTCPAAFAAGFATIVGIAEDPAFIALMFLWMLFLVVVSVKNGISYYITLGLFILAMVAGFFAFMRPVMASFAGTPAAEAAGLTSTLDVFVACGRVYTREMRLWFTRPGWLVIMIFSILPFLASGFAASRGLNSERVWSQYLFHFAMTLCCIFALATPLSPVSVLEPWGIAPVMTTTLAASVAGYLAAYWYILARSPVPATEFGDKPPFVIVFGRRAAPAAGGVLAIVLFFASLINALNCNPSRGAYADACADEILDHLGSRTWLVTDGTLDTHLRTRAATRGQKLDLICLQRDMEDAYLKEFAGRIRERGLFADNADLSISIKIGILPFLQDWFAGDTNITSEVAIFGVPDLWYMAEKTPVPECLFFGGAKNAKGVDPDAAKANFEAFWKKMEGVLEGIPRKGSDAIRTERDPIVRSRLNLRRHVGFVANNLGVLLEDCGREEEAFAMYELVLKTIDKDNVSALFNEFEMARRGVKVALAHKTAIARAVKAVIDNPRQRYYLWSLSRYYGYIRAPEVFARMGYTWARSGQTGNALAQVRRAIDFVPSDRQASLLNMLAAIYASGKDDKKSREVYDSVLAADAANHEALLGIARLEIKEGSIENARTYLERAIKVAKGREADFDAALLHLMNNDLAAARMSLQKITDTNPRAMQAWSLLAGVLLQSYDQEKDASKKAKTLDELEKTILPKMETIAADPRNYFVQLTRALIFLRKGESFRRQARDALVVASMARQDIAVTGDMILNIDIELDDATGAEKHARQILRRNRHDALANYVMGSLRLREGSYAEAETFLRRSVAGKKQIGMALNDLAEVLRRLQNYEEAEKYARDAVKASPKLYVAWETLGSALLDQKKNLDEAETCVNKAISLLKEKNNFEDIRMQITLARVQIARNDLARARGTLRALRSRQAELSSYERNELEKLVKTANMK